MQNDIVTFWLKQTTQVYCIMDWSGQLQIVIWSKYIVLKTLTSIYSVDSI